MCRWRGNDKKKTPRRYRYRNRIQYSNRNNNDASAIIALKIYSFRTDVSSCNTNFTFSTGRSRATAKAGHFSCTAGWAACCQRQGYHKTYKDRGQPSAVVLPCSRAVVTISSGQDIRAVHPLILFLFYRLFAPPHQQGSPAMRPIAPEQMSN